MGKEWGSYIKAMAKIQGKDVLPEVRLKRARKKRKKEVEKRQQPERELRNNVIKELRKRGVKVMRVENGITGKNNTGLPDLWVVNMNKNIAGWMELKSLKGILTGNQPQFREECLRCGVKHWIIRSVSEAMEAIL